MLLMAYTALKNRYPNTNTSMCFIESSAQQFSTEVLDGESQLQALQRVSGLTEQIIVDAATKGAVWVSLARGKANTNPRRLYSLDRSLANVSTILLNYAPEVLQQMPLSVRCIEEHKNYGIWYKPSGMLCQGSKWSDHTVVTQVASAVSGHPCYLVHRLDKAASGLILLAYTKNALKQLAALFQHRQIAKCYQAVVVGKFDKPLPMLIDSPIDNKHAFTTIVAASHADVPSIGAQQCTALQVSIETGRKHQIRKHLASVGYPIVGDRLHGLSNPDSHQEHADQPDLQLIAMQLSFDCPFTQKRVKVSLDKGSLDINK